MNIRLSERARDYLYAYRRGFMALLVPIAMEGLVVLYFAADPIDDLLITIVCALLTSVTPMLGVYAVRIGWQRACDPRYVVDIRGQAALIRYAHDHNMKTILLAGNKLGFIYGDEFVQARMAT